MLPMDERRMIEAHVRDTLAEYVPLADYELFFFGSSTTDTKKYSDIDIGIRKRDGGTLPVGVLEIVQEHMREFGTVRVIDVVDFGAVSKEFAEVAVAQKVLFAE